MKKLKIKSVNFDKIKRKSISGVLALTSRTIILQLINFTGYFIITIFLKKAEFGLFILISTLIDILGYFSDIGLAAALIQKKEKLTLKEIRATFTIQQILIISLIAVSFIFSPLIKRFYNVDRRGMTLFYSFTFAFFLSSLKTIPSVLLERKLEFTKMIIPQFVEAIIFNLIVIVLAWKGLGIESYTFAVLARSISGVFVLYIIAPWKIGLNFSFKELKRLLKFGVPFQLNSLLAVVKDKFMILILGKIIGREGIALVGWAEKWATMPLRYFLDSTIKVAFPAFARLQHNKQKLKKAIEKTLYFLSLVLFPALFGIAVISRRLVFIIPRYSKWMQALTPLYFYCFASILGSLAVFGTTILNSIGKIKKTFKLMIFWTILTWIFTPFLALKFGFRGVPMATLLVNASSIIAIFIIKKYIDIDFISQFKYPFISSLLMLIILFFVRIYIPLNFLGVLLMVVVGIFSYAAMMFFLDKRKVLKETAFLMAEFKKLNLK